MPRATYLFGFIKLPSFKEETPQILDETERLIYRRVQKSDLEVLAKMFEDEETTRNYCSYLGFPVSQKDTKSFHKSLKKGTTLVLSATICMKAQVEGETHAAIPIGFIDLDSVQGKNQDGKKRIVLSIALDVR